MNEIKNEICIKEMDGQLVVSSREVARNFEKQHKDVLEAIRNITAENSALTGTMFIPSEYKAGTGKSYPEYLLTRDGFSLLVMGFTGKSALEWKLKYIEAFNAMEKRLADLNELSPQLQFMINMELEQKRMQKQIDHVDQKVDGIKSIVGLNSDEWRKQSRKMIIQIAQSIGSTDYIDEVYNEIYQLMDDRLGIDLNRRLINKRNRMIKAGSSQSSINKTTKIDIIAEDKKLIEGYISIVKEMAIKYGVADEKLSVA